MSDLMSRWRAAEPHRFVREPYDWRKDYVPSAPKPDAYEYRADADAAHADFLASYHLREADRWMRISREMAAGGAS